MRWRQAPLEELESLSGPWRVVPAAVCFKQLPSLRQKTLGQRAVLAFPEEGEPLLCLRLPRRWAALDGERFLAEPVDSARAWVVALRPGGSHGPTRLQWQDGWPEVFWGESRLGSGCHPRARDWAWAWAPTYGPVILRIYLKRSASEIDDWVESQCPGVWREERSRWSSDCRLRAAPGYLWLSRGYHNPPDEQIDADYFLLMGLAAGALGELEFDLFDGDYYRFMAAGDSCESLRDYLHARAGRGRPHRWNRFRQVPKIEAVMTDVDATSARIAEALGWGPLGLEALLEKLAATPLRELPRHLHVQVWKEIWSEEIWNRFLRAQPRVMFTWGLDEL